MPPSPGGGGRPFWKQLNTGHLFIGLAIISGLITILLFRGSSGPAKETKVEAPQTRPVVVATHELLAGEIISPDSVKVVDWPVDYYPQTNVFEDMNQLVGRVVRKDVFSGQPVSEYYLAGNGSAGGLPVVIPPGYRAITIDVTETKGVAGFIKPGDHVDILGTFNFQLPEASQKAISARSGVLLQDSFDVTQTVMQDVLVLAIAQEMYAPKETPSTGSEPVDAAKKQAEQSTGTDPTKAKIVSSVTLAVTPEQAEKLAYADTKGQLRLTLRPENDTQPANVIGAFTGDVVPIRNVLAKLTGLTAGLEWSNGMGMAPSSAASAQAGLLDTPAGGNTMPPPNTNNVPMATFNGPVGGFGGMGKTIEVIQGNEKSTVSF
jgi:Flp pilus assembly protein CpaB